jgi:hypothetical protein
MREHGLMGGRAPQPARRWSELRVSVVWVDRLSRRTGGAALSRSSPRPGFARTSRDPHDHQSAGCWASEAQRPWEDGVRVSTAFNRLLALEGARVIDVLFGPASVTGRVALRRRRAAA